MANGFGLWIPKPPTRSRMPYFTPCVTRVEGFFFAPPPLPQVLSMAHERKTISAFFSPPPDPGQEAGLSPVRGLHAELHNHTWSCLPHF
jgi:hypothetical protein